MTGDKQKIVRLIYNTYIAVVKNSIGTNLFKNFYANVDGKEMDIMRNGKNSCAFYVSSILVLFKLIKEIHGTVDSTIKDLEESGWERIKKAKVGSILVWEEVNFDGGVHKHIGFFIGNNEAISNSYKLGHPVKHGWNFNGNRKVDLIFYNKNLK